MTMSNPKRAVKGYTHTNGTLSDLAPGHKTAVPFIVEHSCLGIFLEFDGYGECSAQDGDGVPVMLEVYNGKLRVIVWADINQKDPTHVISLEGALESKRKE
ncbi:MAG: hypothetical protein D4S01_07410 [Dehalococcoidia bacterium]|nr:MAG: hypothetical protein D4S01_07410 [Dehalococcoidia bacterium]